MANESWMADIPDDVKLRHITMPGSHDAGVSVEKHSFRNVPVGQKRYVCQTHRIAGQLNSGSRFFDIRFSGHWGTPTTTHDTIRVGGWGENVNRIFDSIKTHLDNNESEIVVVRISHTTHRVAKQVFAKHNKLGNRVYTYTTSEKKIIANQKISDLRGKAIIVYDKDALKNPDPIRGRIRFGKVGPGKEVDKSGIVTCGKFPRSNKMDDILKGALQTVNNHREQEGCNARRPGRDHLCQIYWQLTGGNVKSNTTKGGVQNYQPGGNARYDSNKGTHYNLAYLLYVLRGKKRGQSFKNIPYPNPQHLKIRYLWVPNIISMDFVCEETCSQIIDFTKRNLRFAGKM